MRVRRRRRRRRTVLAVGGPLGLLLSVLLTWTATHAAFTASTANAGNAWQAGNVVLTGGDTVAALFSTATDSALRPGSTRSRCIRIDYTGSLPADIRMYVTTPTSGATALDPYLLMSVERGVDVGSSTTVAADCTTGFTQRPTRAFLYNTHLADDALADQTRTLTDLKSRSTYGTGVVVSSATATNTYLTLRITYAVVDDNAAQGTASSATFTWEAQNT